MESSYDRLRIRLTMRRDALGLSQREVAERIKARSDFGPWQGTISAWERGSRIPTATMLFAWVEALGLALEDVEAPDWEPPSVLPAAEVVDGPLAQDAFPGLEREALAAA